MDNGQVVRGEVWAWAQSQFNRETDLYLQPGRGQRLNYSDLYRWRSLGRRVRGRQIVSVRLDS